MMAKEQGGIVFAQPAGIASAGTLFSGELHRGVFGRFDRRFGFIVFVCMAVAFTVFGVLSMRKPPLEVSDSEISRIQERYARLVLNQPKPAIVEPKPLDKVPDQIAPAQARAVPEEKKEEVVIDRDKETFIEKRQRQESGSETRRQVREQVAREVAAAGIFAAITASASSSGSSNSTSDLLGAASLGAVELGNIPLSKGAFASRNVDAAELIARREARTDNVVIERETVGKAVVAAVASNVQVNITTALPEVSGESSSLQERSQSAIQKTVSSESRRLKRLYEEWLKRDPALSGRLTVKFVILPSGAVSNVSAVKSTTGNAEFDEMVLRYIRRWQFPAVEGAGPVEVVYPFVFEGLS